MFCSHRIAATKGTKLSKGDYASVNLRRSWYVPRVFQKVYVDLSLNLTKLVVWTSPKFKQIECFPINLLGDSMKT